MNAKRRRKVIRIICGILSVPMLLVLLFILNGTVLSDGAIPRSGTVRGVAQPAAAVPQELRVMAFNIAKGFVYEGGGKFAQRQALEARLDAIAGIIRTANPDIVCLSEIVRECGPCDIDQVRYLASRTGLTNWAFGECVSFGLPFYRMVSGNAVISRYPLKTVANLSLHGRRPFYVTKNNRRALACSIITPAGALPFWSLHNDSFDRNNNLRQVQQLLAHPDSQGAFMVGDFNARPTDPAMLEFQNSARFVGVIDGPHTFPSSAPVRTIDFILAPPTYEVLTHTVIPNDASDHCAVMTAFAFSGR